MDQEYQYMDELEDSSEKSDWSEVDSLLEESRRRQENRLHQNLEDIEKQIQERHRVSEKYIEILEKRISVHDNRLDKAGTVNRPFEQEVLAILEDLYESLRGEMREKWRDIQELEQEKREIEKELDELKDAELLDSL